MIRRYALLVVVAAALAACTVVPTGGTGIDNGAAHPSNTVSDKKLPNISSPVDAQFIDQQIGQNQAAIALANQALAHADRQELKTLAASVVETKGVENRRLQAWRQSWFPQAAAIASAPTPAAIVGDAQRPFDLRYLDAAIPFYQNMVQASQQADGKVEHDQLQTLIKDNIIQQNNSVDRMKTWQQDWAKTK